MKNMLAAMLALRPAFVRMWRHQLRYPILNSKVPYYWLIALSWKLPCNIARYTQGIDCRRQLAFLICPSIVLIEFEIWMPQCINQLLFEYFLSPHVDKRRNTHLYLFLLFAPVNVLKLGISCKYSVTKSNQPLPNRDERITESHPALHWLMGVVWFCMIFIFQRYF